MTAAFILRPPEHALTKWAAGTTIPVNRRFIPGQAHVLECLDLHRGELLDDWELARAGEP